MSRSGHLPGGCFLPTNGLMSGAPAPGAIRRPARLRRALGVGAATAAGALVGVLLVLRAVPASSSADTPALAPPRPAAGVPGLPVVTESAPTSAPTSVTVAALAARAAAASAPAARTAPAPPSTPASAALAASGGTGKRRSGQGLGG
jgi:hypothetical protein